MHWEGRGRREREGARKRQKESERGERERRKEREALTMYIVCSGSDLMFLWVLELQTWVPYLAAGLVLSPWGHS